MANKVETILRPLLGPGSKYDGKVKVIFRLQVQPWHASSTLTHEAGLAVSVFLNYSWFTLHIKIKGSPYIARKLLAIQSPSQSYRSIIHLRLLTYLSCNNKKNSCSSNRRITSISLPRIYRLVKSGQSLRSLLRTCFHPVLSQSSKISSHLRGLRTEGLG